MPTISLTAWQQHVAILQARLASQTPPSRAVSIGVGDLGSEIWLRAGDCVGALTFRRSPHQRGVYLPVLRGEGGPALSGDLPKLSAGIADYRAVLESLLTIEKYLADLRIDFVNFDEVD